MNAMTRQDADTRAVEKAMTDALGLATVIHSLGGERGELRIRYENFEQLDALCRKLAG